MTAPSTSPATAPLWEELEAARQRAGEAGGTTPGGAGSAGATVAGATAAASADAGKAHPAEVEIVGAGVTGLACALVLAQAGVRVRVHEARTVAGGASGRNAGFALRGTALAYDDACARLGRETARGLWQLSEEGLGTLKALAGDAFLPQGSLRLAADAAERTRIRAEHDALVADGFAAEWHDPPVGGCGGRFHAALRHPGDGGLLPLRWLRRLAAHAAAAGAELRERNRVVAVAALDAPRVVVATDGYGEGLLPALDGVLVPARGQVLATAPLARRVAACPHYARDGYDYWQQLADGRLVVGGCRDSDAAAETTRDDTRVTAGIQGRLDALAAEIAGESPVVTHRWSGIWGETPDRLPLVGALPEAVAGRSGVWIAAGYSGHGNVLGLVCGALVARSILGEPGPAGEQGAAVAALAPARLLG